MPAMSSGKKKAKKLDEGYSPGRGNSSPKPARPAAIGTVSNKTGPNPPAKGFRRRNAGMSPIGHGATKPRAPKPPKTTVSPGKPVGTGRTPATPGGSLQTSPVRKIASTRGMARSSATGVPSTVKPITARRRRPGRKLSRGG